ncbi:helicase domain protein [Candidatus Moduliflexus flocculans]|uniref:Helicase domain protein n=1 Tax=Candidatus Moduliflexus flocculans TaxID=1499966 RepID=A0A081BNB0_9BACT|nr:helicase domain protein [Candidatus Moduliflexus flocculans]
MYYSAIKDNHSHGTVGEFLKDVITEHSDVSIVSAYFTIYAYHSLKAQLDSIDTLKFLFGEPTFIKALDPEKVTARDFKIEDDTLVIPLERRLTQKTLAKACAEWLQAKAEIRSMVKPNFLHGKLYHITQHSGIEKALAGSSNFTVHGLGLGGSKNIELNLIVDSDRDRQELKSWFDAIWNDQTGLVEDVKAEVLKYLEQLYVENEPEFIYFKTLYHIFEEYLSEQRKGGLLDEKTGFYDSEIWAALYDFQKDGVKGAINKILKHHGCIIADSVGLGKTFEALAVIKYFELLNGRVLVICPKKLAGNWTVYQASQNHALNPFKKDRFNYTVLYHTDMGRESGRSDANGIDLDNFNWGAYDLVVIDESHNFRGNPMEKVKDDGSTRMNRAKWLMEKVIKSGVKTNVLMLSATPVNNSLKDLRNQIAFITEGKEDALFETCKIKSIRLTLENAQKNFTTWAAPKNRNRSMKQLLERLDASFFKLLDELTIARSRKHIVNFYDIDAIGQFPKREKPHSVYPDIDTQKRFPSYDRINKQILEYKLSVFNPSAYLLPAKQAKYEAVADGQGGNFKQADRENFLIGMMKVNYLKRLESSIESFEISLDRTIRKIEKLEGKITGFLQSRVTSQEETLDTLTPSDDEIEEMADDFEAWQVGKKLKFDLADLDLTRWLEDLKNDKEALIDLLNNAKVVTPERDAKLKELQKLILQKVRKPVNGENTKALVFTAFADTARYLYDNLKQWVQDELNLHAALVCGSYTQTSYGKNDYDSILINFSPRSKNRAQLASANQTGEIDILIATDCISEGQNLQDCDFLVNYDIHWNPVRIIQRFGRIDRLGSTNATIQLVNFWPTKDLDNYINLKERVECRMALVDVTATGEDNILNTEQLEELITDDLKYRNQQLKKLQHEVLDIEEMEESISLTDFTLDDFRIELLNFIESNRKRLNESPLGLYAVVPAPGGEHAALITHREITATEKEIIKPGAIFCLAQKNGSADNEAVNPLNPYFLVYIRNDGTVRYNYANAKQILEIYRLLCQNQKRPYEELCSLFNQETENGLNMAKYSDLLRKAVSEIALMFKKKGNARLTSDRGALLLPFAKQINEMDDFELVTWLIVR